MADGGIDAERSSIEIKTLIRKLHPKRNNHKDRIRALSKFRNYVIGDRSGPPEFYDDDLPLLWLGAAAPAQYLEEVNDDLLAMGIYGLLQACGTPSEDHDAALKRSARHAMNLLKWLVMDWKEPSSRQSGDLNLFAKSFLSLDVKHYVHMQLDLHCIGDDRGGAKEDACQLIVQILTKHSKDDDGELQPKPVMMEELIRTARGQQEFELWMARHVAASVQDVIKKNAAARQSELAFQQRQDALATKVGKDDYYDDDEDGDNSDPADDDNTTEEEDDVFDEDADIDVVAAMRKRNKKLRKELKQAEQGLGEKNRGIATRWEDSQLARERRAREASAAMAAQHETVRDSQEAVQEALEREEERAKVLGKDPLGVISEDDFDLATLEKSQAEQMERAMAQLQEELQAAESGASDKVIKQIAAKKESLEAFVDRLGGIEAMEQQNDKKHSILVTQPTFDPLLLLTLVHRKTKFDALMGSMGRLSSKTENQVEQLQNLVRDNFPLFVRCAEGFEQFRKSSEDEVGLGLHDRIDKLEGIAESCSLQAKKSFKPLLDNTNEVRKVQSAMSVLQRVAPILQVPALMRQHIENRRYSQALKTYRRVLVVDRSCRIELLNHVRIQAEECVREARRALEQRVAQDMKVNVEDLLEGIRDLDELIQMTDVPLSSNRVNSAANQPKTEEEAMQVQGKYRIGTSVIQIRDHPPALACLLLQAAHMALGVNTLIDDANTSVRLCAGDAVAADGKEGASTVSPSSDGVDSAKTPTRGSGNQWKYDVLDARVLSTIKSVAFARMWLPRLIRIGRAAKEDERRRAARIGRSVRSSISKKGIKGMQDNQLSSFEVFLTNIAPSITKLVEHAAFCALGSTSRNSQNDIKMTFGADSPEKLRTLLRSPLPPSQSTKVGKELADLVDILSESSVGAKALRPEGSNSSIYNVSPLDQCKTIADNAVLQVEKRRCIYAFDVCSRACSNRASGSGKFDAEALLNCLQNLAQQLSRPEECSNEVEKGCELVVRRCCEGLASYVRDRGDAARLSAVAECADIMSDRITDIVEEASFFTPEGGAVQEVITEDIMGLESAMFDEYLENIRQDVASSVRVGWLESDTAAAEASAADGNPSASPTFPAYLSASLLAIVRCRAQVEQALGDKVRRSENTLYQHLAMATVAEGVVEGICNEVMARKHILKVRQADRLANELEFLKNTLKKFLGDDALGLLNSTLHVVGSRAGRGRDYQGDGPDGLAALEELERLGRVYVLCLGEQ